MEMTITVKKIKWITWHELEVSLRQRKKNLSPRRESKPWPPEHRANALSTKQGERRDRGIEWSLRAFASILALRFILRAQAVVKFALRASSTQENGTGKQRAPRKFAASSNPFFLKNSHVVCQLYCFNLHMGSIALRITHMLTLVVYFILCVFNWTW